MKYRLDKTLREDKSETEESGSIWVEILTSEELSVRLEGEQEEALKWAVHSMKNAKFCKADILKNCIAGTFAVPNKENLLGECMLFGYCMTPKRFIFVDDSNRIEKILNHITEIQVMEKTYVAHFLFEFMEYLIKDDVLFLQQYEEQLTIMEEEILDGKMQDFNSKILHIRKELLKLYAYYQQLADISEILEENQNRIMSEEDGRLFGLFASRVDRLFDHTQMLKEYSLQVREMYQSQIEIKQNQIMKVLTVVTTIFMPLTLIAGWYGMNFVNMPELKTESGYMIVIGVSTAIILAEIWYFKIKKWF